MTGSAATHIAAYCICELGFGSYQGFAGFVDYQSDDIPTDICAFIASFMARTVKDPETRPQRTKPASSALDPSLTVIAQPGQTRYLFVLHPDSRTEFDPDVPILPIPIPGPFRETLMHDIQAHLVNGKAVAASFVVDTDQVKRSDLASAIGKQVHSGAVRLPFCLNMIDSTYGFPQWAIDDHRYQPNQLMSTDDGHTHGQDGDHEHEHRLTLKTLNDFWTHNGVHPPGIRAARIGMFTHNGVHPPGVASYIVVELS